MVESFEVEEPLQFYDAKKDFTTLDAWKKCREVKLFFYNRILPLLPASEKYNLDKQTRSAAVSITANIAEGYGRFHYQEGIQFYRISRGSLYELKDHLMSCADLGYVNEELKSKGIELIEDAKISLNGYIKFVQRQMQTK